MTDGMIIEAVGFLGVIVAILVPIIRLLTGHVKEMGEYTAELSRLVERIENMEKHWTENHAELKDRVREHGKEIDTLNIGFENHEMRIVELEKDNEQTN